MEKENNAADIVSRLDEDYIAAALADLANKLAEIDREATKDVLSTMVDRITLDPVSLDCCIHYQIGVDGRNNVASPRGFERWPVYIEYQRNTAKVAAKFGCAVS